MGTESGTTVTGAAIASLGGGAPEPGFDFSRGMITATIAKATATTPTRASSGRSRSSPRLEAGRRSGRDGNATPQCGHLVATLSAFRPHCGHSM
jgi:hypothetical protein